MAYSSPIQFADSNVAGTTLNGAILAGDNSLTLTSAAVLGSPTSPSFDLLIGTEYITVNGVSGNICTPLSRGANGSTPAGHANGDPVYAPITIGMLAAAMTRLDQANASLITMLALALTGLNASVQTASRIVGAVAPGLGTPWTPAGGPYVAGDIVEDVSNATFWVNTVPGSPGTFISAPSLNLAQVHSLAALMMSLNRTDAAAVMSHLAIQRAGSTKYRLGLDASDQFALLDSTGASINLGVTDAGIATLRNALVLPVSAGGAPAATSFGSVPIKFAETLLGAAAATVTFSSIPGTFRHLKADAYVRGDTAAVTFSPQFRLNNDSAGNYDEFQHYDNNATTLAGFEGLGITAIDLGPMPAATGTANFFGAVEVTVKHYAGATGNKLMHIIGGSGPNNNTLNQHHRSIFGKWRTVATAVTRVDFVAQTGNFAVASFFSVQLEP